MLCCLESVPLLFVSLQGEPAFVAPELFPNKAPYLDCMPLLSFRVYGTFCAVFPSPVPVSVQQNDRFCSVVTGCNKVCKRRGYDSPNHFVIAFFLWLTEMV